MQLITSAHTRSLRVTMGEDVSDLKIEFRAQRSLLQALLDTQREHTSRLETIEGQLENIQSRLGNVEGTLQKVHVGVELIVSKLDRVIGEDED
jgi:hypothetical protein